MTKKKTSIPEGAKPAKVRGKRISLDDPKNVKVPMSSPVMQRQMRGLSPDEQKKFMEMFGTLYIDE
jgi:hypothetical protein